MITNTQRPERLKRLRASIRLTLHQMHNQLMDNFGACPDGPECPFCIADRQASEREHGDYSSDTPGTDEEKRNFRNYNKRHLE